MTDETARPGSFEADAESRFVALLKFDLVGSTEISNTLSPSDELELQRGYKNAVEGLVKADQVRIEWEGDGGLMVFGYPEARVDAAELAVRTGLKLMSAVQAVNVVPRLRLDLRIGIASDRVTVDKTRGSLSRVKPVSRAARLMVYARPGQLLIADDTRRLVKRFFEYEDLGITELQGAGQQRVWRVLRETSVVSRFTAQRLAEAPNEIIGRESVLATLAGAWAGALSGRGSAVCLVADSGIGKSRLARAALEWALRDQAGVLEIDCTPSSGNSPLLPIGVLLQRIAGIGPGASDAEKESAATSLLVRLLGDDHARQSLTYLAPLFGLESAHIPLEKTREQLRAATMAAIVEMVRALAARAPLAILCEDLHWADDTTAQVVQAVGEIAGQLPILIIATRWPKPVTPIDLGSVTAAFNSIGLEPLPAHTATDLVRAVASGRLSSERIEAIVGRCGGVPLLLEEVTRSTLEHTDAGAAVRTSAPSDSGVPPELQVVVESRLEQWPQLRAIIEAASVLGREFPVPLLEAMMLGYRADVPAALSRFADHGLFAPGPSGSDRASFRHALIRDAVYETLVSRDYLRRLHSSAADTLTAQYQGTPDASPDILAEHLRLANRLEEAIKVRLAAGEDTFNRGAYVETMGHCEAVRSLVDMVPDRGRVRPDAFRLCVLLGMVGTGVHGYSAEAAEVAYREAHGMFDDQSGPDSRYPVIRGLATSALVRGDLATAHRYSLEALELARRSERPDYRIDALSVVAYTTFYFGRLEDCRALIDQCLELYEQEGGERFRYPVPQDASTAALALLPTVAWLLGDASGAEQAIVRGLHHVETLGRDFDKALLHAWTAGTRYTQRRYGEALNHAVIAYTLGKEHKFQEWEGVGAMMTLISQSALMPAPEVVAQAVATAQAFQAKGVGLNGSYFLWGIARGYITAGNHAAANAMLGTTLQVASASQETRMNPEIWMLLAELESDRTKATALLADAYHLAVSQGAVANALRAAAMIVRGGADPAAVEWAEATLDLLDGRATRTAQGWMQEELANAERIVEALHPGVITSRVNLDISADTTGHGLSQGV